MKSLLLIDECTPDKGYLPMISMQDGKIERWQKYLEKQPDVSAYNIKLFLSGEDGTIHIASQTAMKEDNYSFSSENVLTKSICLRVTDARAAQSVLEAIIKARPSETIRTVQSQPSEETNMER